MNEKEDVKNLSFLMYLNIIYENNYWNKIIYKFSKIYLSQFKGDVFLFLNKLYYFIYLTKKYLLSLGFCLFSRTNSTS